MKQSTNISPPAKQTPSRRAAAGSGGMNKARGRTQDPPLPLAPPLAQREPLPLTSIASPGPSSLCFSAPVSASHTYTRLSNPPVASREPSLLNARLATESLCPAHQNSRFNTSKDAATHFSSSHLLRLSVPQQTSHMKPLEVSSYSIPVTNYVAKR
jgi:hypothetical protein